MLIFWIYGWKMIVNWTCKESTLYGYEKKIRLYLKPELGGYRVSSIDKKDIADFYNRFI